MNTNQPHQCTAHSAHKSDLYVADKICYVYIPSPKKPYVVLKKYYVVVAKCYVGLTKAYVPIKELLRTNYYVVDTNCYVALTNY